MGKSFQDHIITPVSVLVVAIVFIKVSINSQEQNTINRPITVLVKMVFALVNLYSLPPETRKITPAATNKSAAAGIAKLKVRKLMILLPNCQRWQSVHGD